MEEKLNSNEQQLLSLKINKLPYLKNSSFRIICVSRFRYNEKARFIKEILIACYQQFCITDIQITYAFGERVAYVYFKNFVDAYEAQLTSGNIVLHGKAAVVIAIYESFRLACHNENNMFLEVSDDSDSETSLSLYADQLKKEDFTSDSVVYCTFIPYSENMSWLEYKYYLQDIPIEEYKNTSRTLYVGNLMRCITRVQLCNIFRTFGVIENICIKYPIKANCCPYAFIEYKHLEAAYQAKSCLSGRYLGEQECKISYASTMPTSKLWIGGLGPWVSAKLLKIKFQVFGTISEIQYVDGHHCAYVTYDFTESAKKALIMMRGNILGQKKHYLRMDFAVSRSNISEETISTSNPYLHSPDIKSICKPRPIHSNYHDIFDPIKTKIKISKQDRIIFERCKKRNKRQLSPVIGKES